MRLQVIARFVKKLKRLILPVLDAPRDAFPKTLLRKVLSANAATLAMLDLKRAEAQIGEDRKHGLGDPGAGCRGS